MLMNEYCLSDTEYLVSLFEKIQINPYHEYTHFRDAVADIISSEDKIREEIANIAQMFRKSTKSQRKVALIRNCPTDRNIPLYDADNPVFSKHILKKTFVGEALLELVSQVCELPILAYTTRNKGDFFQDVYAQQKYFDTQTQKTDSDLYFHNDRTAHMVRADALCLLGMRSDPQNIINTKYIHGEDLLNLIDREFHNVLRQPDFITPFDRVSRDSNAFQIQSENHPILTGESSFRYYDTRTTVSKSAPDIAWRALVMLKNAITRSPRLHVSIQKGDLFIFPNLEGLHSRDKAHISNPETARQRYLLKTYNLWNNKRRDQFSDFYVHDIPGLLDDTKNTQTPYSA